MGKLIPLMKDWIEIAKDFTSLIEQGKITHAVMIYRLGDGGLEWSAFGTDDMTYLVGLAERLKTRLCANVDEEQTWEEGD